MRCLSMTLPDDDRLANLRRNQIAVISMIAAGVTS